MIDMSKLPAPAIIEPLDFEGVFAELAADFRERFPDFDALVESDPAIKLMEAFAYREVLLRARVNAAAKACMLAYAAGADLDNIAANFGVQRKEGESDADLRRRTLLAIEASATAGSRNSYLYHALGVEGVFDATATSPSPGLVHVHVMGTDAVSDMAVLCANVAAVLNADTVRPLTDTVEVYAAVETPYAVKGTLYVDGSLDAATVLANARAALESFVEGRRRLGGNVSLSALSAAAFVEGVADFALSSPAAGIACDAAKVPVCTGIELETQPFAGALGDAECVH